jgi:hypothetical protein
MSGRTVHAIRVQLQGMADRSVIIWLKSDAKLCIELLNPRRTWLTARRGDAVILRHNGTQAREHIDAIELHVSSTHFSTA